LVHVKRLLDSLPNVRLIAPQGYRNFVALMIHCRLVLTDSGGVQEEAPSLGKPVLVMRDTTERPEGVAAGTALLTGAKAPAIVEHATRLLTDEVAYRSMATARNPYGDGHAAERIVERIRRYFATAVREVRAAEGFAPLPRRLDEERPVRVGPNAQAVANVGDFVLSPREFTTRTGGLFLFVPDLVQLESDALAQAAKLPGSRMIPSAHALRASLALKL
jgi:hypothetical protein